MTYTKEDFGKIVAELELHLCADVEDPLPCRLFEATMPTDRDNAKLRDGTLVDHVADACNLASSIQGVYTLLKLANNDQECEHLSRVLVRELGALREAVQTAEEEQIHFEKHVLDCAETPGFSAEPAEKNIRLWADILKHPAATIVSHQCFSNDMESEVVIDTATMRKLEKEMLGILRSDGEAAGNASKAWSKVWEKYSGKTVQFQLPTIMEVEVFLRVTADRIENLIARRVRIAALQSNHSTSI